jgi:hypothetical protein
MKQVHLRADIYGLLRETSAAKNIFDHGLLFRNLSSAPSHPRRDFKSTV